MLPKFTASTTDKLSTSQVDQVRYPLCDCLQHFLTKDGRWGRQDKARWNAFLDWLSDRKLLTTKVQSRTVVQGLTASLDDLRTGDAGEVIPRGMLVSDTLFTNEYLS